MLYIRLDLGGPQCVCGPFCVSAPSGGTSERRVHLVQVLVRDNNVDQALRALKKKLQREGVFRAMKLRRHYEKPSERRAREKAEAVRLVDSAETQDAQPPKPARPNLIIGAERLTAYSSAAVEAEPPHPPIALTISSHIFLASPNSIIVLSR